MKNLIDHFGILAPFYERFIQPRIPEELLELIGPPSAGPLLDAGGGTGRVAQFLRSRAGMVVVADQSYRMLTEAAKKEGLRSVCSLTERLPFSAMAFDRIVIVDAFHHVADQKATCEELWRLLKPGGRIVIEEPDVTTFGVKLLALAEKLALMRSHFISPEKIADLFCYPSAITRIVQRDSTAWLIIEKAI